MYSVMRTKTVIQSVMAFNCEDKSPASPSLKKAISPEALFSIDNEEMLLEELERLGFAPRKVDVELVSKNLDEKTSFKEALMVDDPCVGSVILYLMKDELSIH